MKKKAANTAKKPAATTGIPEHMQVVAIGASAGGLEAITELLQHLTPDTGMVFIYIPHLSPDHKSLLSSLLSKATKMKVQEVTDKVLMKPNNFYVIPPDKEMTLLDGHIQLSQRTKERVLHLPIDTFFSSLADTYKEYGTGVVLSGSASDGTRGLLAIKAAGGLTFAQNDTAKFTSMPQSAVTAGAVDFVLSPKEIAKELIRMSKYDYLKRDIVKRTEHDIDNADPDLKIIINLLLKETQVDFSNYKLPTIKRRIVRRMLLNKIKSLKEYARFCIEKKDEINILYQDLLINVTNFFRDTDAHNYLKSSLFPKLLKSKNSNAKLRIWIPACASGEEAYSIAMILLEIQEEMSSAVQVQIFATDLSSKAITKARIAEYTKPEVELVSPRRLQRFYTKTGSKYRIVKTVRDMCVFAPHNILRDPPFSKVDFISCCNLFIYFDAAAQKKALTTFHYALNDEGFLMLGKSETVGIHSHLFAPLNNRYKIYVRKKNTGERLLPDLLPKARLDGPGKNNLPARAKNHTAKSASFDSEIDDMLLSKFVPASVVINHDMEILQFRGNTHLFLQHPTGKASLNILKLTAPEIAFELRHSIPMAIKNRAAIRKAGIEVKAVPGLKVVTLEIMPLQADWEEPLLLVVFTIPELVETFLQEGKSNKQNLQAKDRKIKRLEEELAAARADMHAYAQEQEAFIEELQSTNEEVVSSNEELQSVNEELETSKEEIESTNEELTTTNQELHTRNELLNEAHEYAAAIINNLHEPLLVLDRDLRVVSASQSFYKKFSTKPDQTEGVLLYDLGNKEWDIPALRQLLEEILPKNSQLLDYELTHTFPIIGERIFSLNASRIVQKVQQEELMFLAIADITEVRKRAKEMANKEKDILERLNKELEKAVSKRTAELQKANEQLEENNISLQILNKELQSFSYVASHDLQEPLRKIQTLASRILESETALTEKGKDYFDRMQKSAARMKELIEDLLAFSSVQNIKGRKFITSNLNTIVEEVKTQMAEVIEEKKASIIVEPLCDIKIIPHQFRQVMLNLLSNALKFTRESVAPVITIKSDIVQYNKITKQHLPPLKEYCHITVEDNGIGFESEYSDKIFDIFQRLHAKDEYPGTGIGLAIVKKIIENHQGIITARSKVGRGSVFEIYIPT